MQRLNIPLSRHTRTTRRNKRVVWVQVGFLLSVLFVLSRFGTSWFTRDSILLAAPVDTVLAVQFELSPKTQESVQKILSTVPLISNRSLSIDHVFNWSQGELAVFITKTGERAIAIRADESSLPEQLLINYGITTQDIGSYILLSESLLPINGISSSVKRPFLPSFRKTWIGRVTLPDSDLAGNIYLSKKDVVIELNTPKNTDISNGELSVPAAFYLSNLSFSDSDDVLSGISRLTQSFSQDSDSESILSLGDVRSEVIFSHEEATRGVLLVLEDSTISSEDLLYNLQLIGAFARPHLVEKPLSDGTSYQEITVAPDLVSIEEISLSGSLAYRVSLGADGEVLALRKDNNLYLSNNSKLVEAYFSDEILESTCKGNAGSISPSILLSQMQRDQIEPAMGGIYTFFERFPLISFELKKYSSEIRFCFE
jgi:hypothetical protein